MVQICLGGLAPKFGAFRTAVCTQENTPSFFNLQSMLLVEENHAGASTSMHTDSMMLYTEGDRPRGCGGQGESVRNGGGQRDQGRSHRSDDDSNSGPSGNRGSQGDKNRQGKSIAECWYYGKQGHRESECWKKRANLERTGSSNGSEHTDKGNRQRSHYAVGSEKAGKGSAFVKRHEANSMK